MSDKRLEEGMESKPLMPQLKGVLDHLKLKNLVKSPSHKTLGLQDKEKQIDPQRTKLMEKVRKPSQAHNNNPTNMDSGYGIVTEQ